MRYRSMDFEKEATLNMQKRPLGRFYICITKKTSEKVSTILNIIFF